jgi:hypothetical protein
VPEARRWLLMKLVADSAMVVIGLTIVVGGVLGAVRYRPAEPYSSPDQRPADTATVYVSGSEGVAYWMQWDSFSGALGGRKEGVVGEEPAVYEIDLSQASTDGSDTLEVWAGKSERDEGDLTLAVEVGEEFVGWEYSTRADPALSEMYVSHTLDT